MDDYIKDHTCIITARLVPRSHLGMLKGIRTGVDFGSGTETKLLLSSLASFPGRSCLQFLIACSMQKRRGKAWEKESCA